MSSWRSAASMSLQLTVPSALVVAVLPAVPVSGRESPGRSGALVASRRDGERSRAEQVGYENRGNQPARAPQ
jgi:hypothetical protein